MLQETALKILQTGTNVFLTGEPGSGKTHTVNAYIAWLRDKGIEPAITASTGIAATHVGGMTIHSWSGIGVRRELTDWDLDAISQNKRIIDHARGTNVLIIDEISMLAADTLDMVDRVLREVRGNSYAFGGMQVVLVGDFFQLPPVVKDERGAQDTIDMDTGRVTRARTPFAFNARAWRELNPLVCYLHEQHRQSDARSAQVLGALRRGAVGPEIHRVLGERSVDADALPAEAPKLFTHNLNVDRMNDERLAAVPGTQKRYDMIARGPAHMVEALKRGCLSPESLVLKVGARVMFTKNDPAGRYVNGTLGEVVAFTGSGLPSVRTKAGRTLDVEPTEWKLDDGGKTLARIAQVPLRLAWAMTVHKSQGMTLDAAVIDLSEAFEYGQGYVALSRVRSLAGLYLLGYNERALLVHPEAAAADVVFKKQSASARARFEEMSDGEHIEYRNAFITAAGGSVAGGTRPQPKKRAPKRQKGDSALATLALLEKGMDIDDVMTERKLAKSTVVTHVCELFMQDKLDRADIERLLSREVRAGLRDIHAAFKKHGTKTLVPVHTALKRTYSFQDLELARLLFDAP
ncbi:AAA family ATPase [Candidatus Kaiserbacteria bacterium]|nr:AAA family ATPase [Candidatus Kaiserbacteria bacterium]